MLGCKARAGSGLTALFPWGTHSVLMLYVLKVHMGCGAEEATPAAPVPELRLNGSAGVRVGSASPPSSHPPAYGACPQARLDQPLSFLLLSLILPLTAKSFGGALYQRGPGLSRGMGCRPPQSRQDRNQIGINKGVAIQVKTRLGQAKLPHGT